MSAKDPHLVLGVQAGAGPDEIKAAWRRLARRHHPDLTGDDPDAARRATRRMAEINEAYASLVRSTARRGRAAPGAEPGSASNGRSSASSAARRTRPVTGRVDMSETFRPRNQTTTPPGVRIPLRGHPPLRFGRRGPDLRASEPSGPLERARLAGFRGPDIPTLDEAVDMELDFGKFHGHTLGEVAAFEPSYIDWLATSVARNPELTSAARVIRDELDRRGVRRVHRPARPGWRSSPLG